MPPAWWTDQSGRPYNFPHQNRGNTMQDNIRPIAPISIAGLVPQAPDTGMPICEVVDPATLYVDPAYQRNVSEKGMRQIRRIIEGFDWAKFKPPVCAYSQCEGKTILKVLDGQHTAIAAASNPHVRLIPVMIVEADDTIAQAKAFIGQNTDRLGITTLQLHQAALAACNEDAQTLELVCSRAGIKVLKTTNAYTGTGSRQTIAIKQIEALISRQGRRWRVKSLRCWPTPSVAHLLLRRSKPSNCS